MMTKAYLPVTNLINEMTLEVKVASNKKMTNCKRDF